MCINNIVFSFLVSLTWGAKPLLPTVYVSFLVILERLVNVEVLRHRCSLTFSPSLFFFNWSNCGQTGQCGQVKRRISKKRLTNRYSDIVNFII